MNYTTSILKSLGKTRFQCRKIGICRRLFLCPQQVVPNKLKWIYEVNSFTLAFYTKPGVETWTRYAEGVGAVNRSRWPGSGISKGRQINGLRALIPRWLTPVHSTMLHCRTAINHQRSHSKIINLIFMEGLLRRLKWCRKRFKRIFYCQEIKHGFRWFTNLSFGSLLFLSIQTINFIHDSNA